MNPDGRCGGRKHVAERGQSFCDCGALTVGATAAKNALVVTILDPVQADAVLRMGLARAQTPPSKETK